jgi:hypothetical protein
LAEACVNVLRPVWAFLIKIIIIMKKDITLEDIIDWIIRNNEEREAIDKINSVTFPFTSKYLGYVKAKTKKGWKVAGKDADNAF